MKYADPVARIFRWRRLPSLMPSTSKRKQIRKELFLIEMDRLVPWQGIIALIEPHCLKVEGGRSIR
ncbi:hypothetical protein AB7M33_003801 [Pseudomonas sp. Y3 TE3536]